MRYCSWVTWYDASFKANTDDRRNGEASVWPTCIRPEYLLIIPNLHENKLYENNYTNTTHSEAKSTDHIPSVEYLGIFSSAFSLAFAAFHSWGTYSCLLCGWSCSTGSVIDQCCQCLRSMGILEKWNGQRCPSCYLYSGLLSRVACELFFWRLCGWIADGTSDLRMRMRQRFCRWFFNRLIDVYRISVYIYMVFWIFRGLTWSTLVLWCTLHISKLLAALRMRERRKDYNMKCCTTWDV